MEQPSFRIMLGVLLVKGECKKNYLPTIFKAMGYEYRKTHVDYVSPEIEEELIRFRYRIWKLEAYPNARPEHNFSTLADIALTIACLYDEQEQAEILSILYGFPESAS